VRHADPKACIAEGDVLKRALVVAPQPFYTPRGTPFSVYYRTAAVAGQDVRIDLLTYGEGEDVSIPGVRIIRIPRFARLGNVKVGPSFLKIFLDLFILAWMVALLARNRYDFVHAHEEAVFLARFLKPVFGFRLVYDMHSSLPQQLTNFRFTTSRSLIGLFRRLEISCINAAEAVVTICPDLYKQVDTVIRDKGRNLLIENSLFEPVNLARKSPGPDGGAGVGLPLDRLSEGRRLVVYTGTLEPYQGVEILVDAFRTVVAKDPEAFLLVVGGTEEQAALLRQRAASAGISRHSLFTGRVPQQAAQRCIGSAAVLVSPRCEGTNTPLKIYEYLASGVPIVATAIWSHTQILTPDVAVLVQPDPDDMARGILEALTEDGRGRTVAGNARHLYETRYSRQAYEEKIRAMLERIAA
jgi:glycosyltransferase involved in cell wall biosynthesis